MDLIGEYLRTTYGEPSPSVVDLTTLSLTELEVLVQKLEMQRCYSKREPPRHDTSYPSHFNP